MNPFSLLYRAATAARNSLFDRGLLRSRALEKPVISVGNLSVGGAGKTPFVIALGEMLQARGIAFDVLSRGYRRKSRGVLLVEAAGSVSDFGDEPLLIARRLGVPVIVGESRYQAGLLAEQKFRSQLHILDDGFQHRSVARDFDIVLLAPEDFSNRLLPSGRLREPLSSLARADAVGLPEALPADLPELQGKLIWRMKREIRLPATPWKPIVFCGIARPEQFFAQVRAIGITAGAEIAYRDHHAYDEADVQGLLARRDQVGGGGFITTEKDAVNLGPLQSKLEPLAVATLELKLAPADVLDTILAVITERKPRS